MIFNGKILCSGKRRVTVHLNDGTDRSMVVSEIQVEDGVASFGRDDGNGWRPFLTAPLTSITSWDYQ